LRSSGDNLAGEHDDIAVDKRITEGTDEREPGRAG
jgi:hypothetical protein